MCVLLVSRECRCFSVPSCCFFLSLSKFFYFFIRHIILSYISFLYAIIIRISRMYVFDEFRWVSQAQKRWLHMRNEEKKRRKSSKTILCIFLFIYGWSLKCIQTINIQYHALHIYKQLNKQNFYAYMVWWKQRNNI